MTDYSLFKQWDDPEFEFEIELMEALYTGGEYEEIADKMLAIWNVMFSEKAEKGSAFHEMFEAIAYAGWCAGITAAAKGTGKEEDDLSNGAFSWLERK